MSRDYYPNDNAQVVTNAIYEVAEALDRIREVLERVERKLDAANPGEQ